MPGHPLSEHTHSGFILWTCTDSLLCSIGLHPGAHLTRLPFNPSHWAHLEIPVTSISSRITVIIAHSTHSQQAHCGPAFNLWMIDETGRSEGWRNGGRGTRAKRVGLNEGLRAASYLDYEVTLGRSVLTSASVSKAHGRHIRIRDGWTWRKSYMVVFLMKSTDNGIFRVIRQHLLVFTIQSPLFLFPPDLIYYLLLPVSPRIWGM